MTSRLITPRALEKHRFKKEDDTSRHVHVIYVTIYLIVLVLKDQGVIFIFLQKSWRLSGCPGAQDAVRRKWAAGSGSGKSPSPVVNSAVSDKSFKPTEIN